MRQMPSKVHDQHQIFVMGERELDSRLTPIDRNAVVIGRVGLDQNEFVGVAANQLRGNPPSRCLDQSRVWLDALPWKVDVIVELDHLMKCFVTRVFSVVML